jgi:hypothetical protein
MAGPPPVTSLTALGSLQDGRGDASKGRVRDGQERAFWPPWPNKQGMPSPEPRGCPRTGERRLTARKTNPAVECIFFVGALMAHCLAPSTVTAGDEPPMNSQVPSALSSSLSARRRPVKPSPSGFTGPTPRLGSRGIHQQSALCSYPVHRSLPPTRRSSSDERIVPSEAWDNQPNLHANPSLLRATRTASKSLHLTPDGAAMRSPARENRVEYLLGGEIRSGPGSKLIGAPPRMFPLCTVAHRSLQP